LLRRRARTQGQSQPVELALPPGAYASENNRPVSLVVTKIEVRTVVNCTDAGCRIVAALAARVEAGLGLLGVARASRGACPLDLYCPPATAAQRHVQAGEGRLPLEAARVEIKRVRWVNGRTRLGARAARRS
jgi:hypothetical protein